MANADDDMAVEVVAGTPGQQALIALSVPAGTTAGNAIIASGIDDRFDDIEVHQCEIAIWGRVVDRETILKSGDRIEILRPLQKDPREARREVAGQGGFMGSATRKPE